MDKKIVEKLLIEVMSAIGIASVKLEETLSDVLQYNYKQMLNAYHTVRIVLEDFHYDLDTYFTEQ